MIFFYAGANFFPELIVECGVENVLLSYFYLKDEEDPFSWWKEMGIKKIFLDSGGFTARSKGLTIDVKDYGRFIKKHKKDLFCYANLDVQNTEATQSNQRCLEGQGLNPLPVFHYDEFRNNKELLFEYTAKHNYIAVGGIAGTYTSFNKLKFFLDFVFAHTKDKVKVHGFGISGQRLLKRYPFYSADSTSWLQGGKYGAVREFDGRKLTDTPEPKKRLVSSKGYKAVNKRSLQEFIKHEQFINKLWKIRGVKWN